MLTDKDIKEYDLNVCLVKLSALLHMDIQQDEFEAMNCFFEQITVVEKSAIINLLRGREKYEEMAIVSNMNKRIKQSQDLRQKGNDLFNTKGGDIKHNIMAASHLYTEAIFSALGTNNDELSYAFANRAMALQSFGYYQQAYDDCVCALNLNYPSSKRHKIILRQAHCSIKLKHLATAEKHLKELQVLPLNKTNENELQKLMQAFEELKHKINANNEDSTGVVGEDVTKIKTEEGFIDGKGRCLRTKCAIKENEFIFSDQASAFIPIAGTMKLCHQCAITHFIPIPCLQCCGRVIYCSLKCLNDHSVMHKYECQAFRLNLFPQHKYILPLRLLLDNGIFSILEDLKLINITSISQLWCELKKGGKPYVKVLHMMSNFSKKPYITQKILIFLSYYWTMYLKEFTNFFEMLNVNNMLIDWKRLIASLLLLHLCQTETNSQGITLFTSLECKLTIEYPFHMLNANLWLSPWHLKLGRLIFLSHYEDLGSMVLPYFSLCNHSCVRLFGIKFCGRLVKTYALHDLKKGKEITTCYTVDNRQIKRKARQNILQQNYHFKCQCEDCSQTDIEDVEFNKFNQYRCDNIKCGEIFVPHENQIEWYNTREQLNCTICGHKQNMKEFFDVFDMLPYTAQPFVRDSLYRKFKKLKEKLLGLNGALCTLAHTLVMALLMLKFEVAVFLNKNDYRKIIDMVKFVLLVTKTKHQKQSYEYLSKMTCLFDLIAYRKYEPTKCEINEMLTVIDVLLDDNTKRIYLNYYNDYIKDFVNK